MSIDIADKTGKIIVSDYFNRRLRELDRDFLRDAGISVSVHHGPVVNPLWETGFRSDVLMVPLCWKDILINAMTIPFEMEFLLPYGIFHRPEPHSAVKSFLEFIFSTCGEGNASGIVPVLEQAISRRRSRRDRRSHRDPPQNRKA